MRVAAQLQSGRLLDVLEAKTLAPGRGSCVQHDADIAMSNMSLHGIATWPVVQGRS